MYVTEFPRQILSSDRFMLSLKVFAVVFFTYQIGTVIYNRFFHPYRDVPGPFWASITNLWYFRSMRYGIAENYQWPIHEKYGPLVRLAPNMVSISDPAAVEIVYSAKPVFRKTEFYDGFQPNISRRSDSFSDRDDRHHASRRRITAPLYTQQNILAHEKNFDRVIALFYKQMDKFAETGEEFDVSIWIRRYTFDIIGELFYGREGGFGFIRDDKDHNNWCHLMEHMPGPVSAINYAPYGLRILYMMSQLLWKKSRTGMLGYFTVVKQARAATNERLAAMNQPDFKPKNDNLQKLMNIHMERGPEIDWSLDDVTTELWAMIWAGSDTTAIALTSIFYHLHRHSDVLKKLLDELDEAFDTGKLTYPLRFLDCVQLPYLRAVVQESMRIHSSLGTGLPRVVPKGGAEICGRYFQEGGEVIMTAGAVHFDKGVFGEDSQQFRPERWLDEKKAAEMERNWIQFGYGPRMCLGKHVTNTEMYKLLPTVLRDFQFDLQNDEWTVFRGWFQHQKNVRVRVSRRQPKTATTPSIEAILGLGR